MNRTMTGRRAIAPALALAFSIALAGCSDGEDAAAPPPSTPAPTPAPPPPAAPPAAPWAEVEAAVDAAPIADLRLIIGDANGVLFEYEKGDFAADGFHLVASSSKLLTGVTLFRLVERGVMALDDAPQDYLPFWTDDPADARSRVTLEQLLSFTSGFNASPAAGGCITVATTTVQACAEEFNVQGLDTDPGEAFSYGPAHMQIAAAMAEIATGASFADTFRTEVAVPLGLSPATQFLTPSATNPRAAGGAGSTAADYAAVLRALMAGDLIADIAAFTLNRTENAIFLFRPSAVTVEGGDWRYGLGFWRECDLSFFAPPCDAEVVISSAGAFGWTPWIDFDANYFALIAVEEFGLIGDGPSTRSTALEQTLQPLIEQALAAVRN